MGSHKNHKRTSAMKPPKDKSGKHKHMMPDGHMMPDSEMEPKRKGAKHG